LLATDRQSAPASADPASVVPPQLAAGGAPASQEPASQQAPPAQVVGPAQTTLQDSCPEQVIGLLQDPVPLQVTEVVAAALLMDPPHDDAPWHSTSHEAPEQVIVPAQVPGAEHSMVQCDDAPQWMLPEHDPGTTHSTEQSEPPQVMSRLAFPAMI
jgi:hypothetical protein